MTTTELNTLLLDYAKEDTGYAIQSGSMSICDTKQGVISINHEDNIFEAFNNLGEALTGKMNREQMQNWIVKQYIVEIEVED